MNLIEITYPDGALDADARAQIAAQLTAGMLGTDAAPEATMRRARAMTHIVFHSAQGWMTGDGPLPADQHPPYLVTVTVPEAWREEMSKHVISLIRVALERHGPGDRAERPGGDVWINVVGVSDGSIGLNGRPSTADDVLMYMTEEYRAVMSDEELPDGVAADPICGMHVRLGPKAITLVHDGETVGFCAEGCRAAYANMHGIEVAAA